MRQFKVSFKNTALGKFGTVIIGAASEEWVTDLFYQRYQSFCKILKIEEV